MSPDLIVKALNQLPPEISSLLMLLTCGLLMLSLMRFFQLAGLYLFTAIAVICGNIQVLKSVDFSLFPTPVAVGSIVFAATYMCSDIITEHYGAKAARKAVWLGFAAMFAMTVLMNITLGWAPLNDTWGAEYDRFRIAHEAMETLFLPAPAIFLASVTAYLISQYNDIWIFQLVKRVTGNKYLWLRTNLSTMISALIDNTIFSVLAWVVLAPAPMDWHTVIFTYILGTFALRCALSMINTPFVYLSRYFVSSPNVAVQ